MTHVDEGFPVAQLPVSGKAHLSPVSLQDLQRSFRVAGSAPSNGWKIFPADVAGYPDLTLEL